MVIDSIKQRIQTALLDVRIRRAVTAGTAEERFLYPLLEAQKAGKTFSSPLIVCTGNICRSPYAERKLKALLAEEARADDVLVRSAGTVTTPGKEADPVARRIAKTRKIDLDTHRTSAITESLVRSSDLILTMQPSHLTAILKVDANAAERTVLLGALLLPDIASILVPDPYGQPDEAFQDCFEQLDQALTKLVKEWRLL